MARSVQAVATIMSKENFDALKSFIARNIAPCFGNPYQRVRRRKVGEILRVLRRSDARQFTEAQLICRSAAKSCTVSLSFSSLQVRTDGRTDTNLIEKNCRLVLA